MIYQGTDKEIDELARVTRDHVCHQSNKELFGRELLTEILGTTRSKIESVEHPAFYLGSEPYSMVVGENGYFTIYLINLSLPFENNFQIAHDLGHYFLHYVLSTEKTVKKFPRFSIEPMEFQANRFAGSLLMPETILREKFEEFGGDLWKLSGFFSVRMTDLIMRLQIIGVK